MTINLQAIVRWHNALPRAVQIDEVNLKSTRIMVPYWRAKTQARFTFRYQVGAYSEQTAAVALLAYNAALAEHRMRVEEWHRKDEEARWNARSEGITSGVSSLARTAQKGWLEAAKPRPPTELDAVAFSLSKPLVATASLDAFRPACQSSAVLSKAGNELFDWLLIHGSFDAAMASTSCRKLVADEVLLQRNVSEIITPVQDQSIRAYIMAQRDRYVGSYEIVSCEFDEAPGVVYCHAWEVMISVDGRTSAILVGSDGEIYGNGVRARSRLQMPAIGLLVLAVGGGGWWQLGGGSEGRQSSAVTITPPLTVSAVSNAVAPPSAKITTVSALQSTKPMLPGKAISSTASAVEQLPTLPTLTLADTKCILQMLQLAADGHWDAIEVQAKAIRAAAQVPPRGQRKIARQLNGQALELMAQHQFGAAANLFKQAQIADPSDVEILNNLGNALVSAGQYTEGIDIIGVVLMRVPERTSAWVNLSEAWVAAGREPEAFTSLRLAAFFSSNRVRTAEYLGQVRDSQPATLSARIAQQLLDELPVIPQRTDVVKPDTAGGVSTDQVLPKAS